MDRRRLRYALDNTPGYRRRRYGSGFRYLYPDGRPLRDLTELGRIRSLAIPPAWTQVWISSDPHTHLQATGRDARGRKQYRYHPAFRERRDTGKYQRMLALSSRLGRIRRRVDGDLRRPGLPRDKVLALVVRLLELTHLRVGNDSYARLNRSFGLTTLRDRHAKVEGGSVRFRFRGKSGKDHELGLRDRRLAGLVARCQDLPGQELFQYLDETGAPVPVRSDDVNAYLREAAGIDVTAKDLRTWGATVLAYRELRRARDDDPPSGTPVSAAARRRRVNVALDSVAARLGNTRTVCRGSYVHPAIIDWFEDQPAGVAGTRARSRETEEPPTHAEERAVATILRRRLEERPRARRRS
jgi:DNA topoisomerase-1